MLLTTPLVHSTHRFFLFPVLIAYTHGGMARLSWPEKLVNTERSPISVPVRRKFSARFNNLKYSRIIIVLIALIILLIILSIIIITGRAGIAQILAETLYFHIRIVIRITVKS